MSAIADGIDFLVGALSRRSKVGADLTASQTGYRSASAMVFSLMVFSWIYVWQGLGAQGFSCTITAAAMTQTFGFVIMCLRVRMTKSVEGLSSKTLLMFILTLCIRLCATTLKRGYVPVDGSGQGFYQMLDVSTVICAAHLTYCCHKTYRHTYRDEHDDLPLLPLIVPAFILAYFINSNLNRSFFFDYVWFVSMNLETVSMVPQLWLMSKVGGKQPAISSQFVASNVANKVLACTFWVFAYSEVSKRNAAVDPTNVAGKQIMSAYVLQLFMSADFMFYYVKGLLEGDDSATLPESNVDS